MQRDGLVSVIMPVYNRARLVGRAIESVLAQTYAPFEILCVDDHSTDDSRTVIESYHSKYPQQVFYLLNARSKGVSGARNSGLLAARGEFIAFLDSDDRYKPIHLSEAVKALRTNPDIGWFFADFERWRDGRLFEPSVFASNADHMKAFHPVGDGSLKRRPPGPLPCAHILHETLPGVHTSVLRWSACEGLLFDERIDILEDWKYRFDAIKRGIGFGYTETVHHEYHIHESNSSAAMDYDSAKALRQCEQFEKIAMLVAREHALSAAENRAFTLRLREFLFWSGYAAFRHDHFQLADDLMGRSLSRYGWRPRMLKTYALFKLRRLLQDRPRR
jgi:glycosyltransferase involved in cell wall biosynthesis